MKAIFFLLVALVLTIPAGASAWKVNTCNGKVTGMRTNRTFTIDSCNIPFGSERYKAVVDSAAAWNRIAGVHDRINLVMKNHGCKIQDDDVIVFVPRQRIDGNSGFINYEEKRCGVGDNDGRRYDFKIYIAEDLDVNPATPNTRHQTVRQVLFHEFGHALGAEHDRRGVPNMMWDPGPPPTLANSPVEGLPKALHAEALLPDDIDFALKWHGGDGTYVEYDIAAGAQWFNATDLRGELLNPPSQPESVCLGWGTSVNISHWITGGRPFSCTRNDKVEAWIVLSRVTGPSDHISNRDRNVQTWSLCGDPGQSFQNTARFTIPWDLTPGTYRVGFIIDPNNRVRETDERNNAVDLGKVLVVNYCKPPQIVIPPILFPFF